MNAERIGSTCGKAMEANAPGGLCPECLIQVGLSTGVNLGADTKTGTARPPFVPPSVEELAKNFPQLEILELIGKGGIGAVGDGTHLNWILCKSLRAGSVLAAEILPADETTANL